MYGEREERERERERELERERESVCVWDWKRAIEKEKYASSDIYYKCLGFVRVNYAQSSHSWVFSPPPAPCAGCYTQLISNWSTSGLNSQFSISYTGCLTKAKWPNLPYCIYFPMVLERMCYQAMRRSHILLKRTIKNCTEWCQYYLIFKACSY